MCRSRTDPTLVKISRPGPRLRDYVNVLYSVVVRRWILVQPNRQLPGTALLLVLCCAGVAEAAVNQSPRRCWFINWVWVKALLAQEEVATVMASCEGHNSSSSGSRSTLDA